MAAQRFAHVGLCCKDPAATEQFYTRHFGFRRARVLGSGPDQVVFIKTASGDLSFELFRATEPAGPPPSGAGPGSPCYRHLAFQVDSVDATLAALGADARVTAGPMNFDHFIPGWRTAWIADPDDRIVEITQGYVDQDQPSA